MAAGEFGEWLGAVGRAIRGKVSTRAYGGVGRITQGGVTNPGTGMGTSLDKTQGSFFQPTQMFWRSPLEVLRAQSAFAKKYTDLLIDDMFIKWRDFKDGDVEGSALDMRKAERRYRLQDRLRRGMKGGRAHGTSLVVLYTKEAAMDTPLDPKRIKEGDLQNIRVFDRYDASVGDRDYDPAADYYGPINYNIHPTRGNGRTSGRRFQDKIHASRIMRFDGLDPLTDSRFTVFDEDWGLSVLLPVITSILEDQSIISAIAHMTQEASIPVLAIRDLREGIKGNVTGGEATVDQIGSAINRLKSVYRLMMLEKDQEEFQRVAVQFGGLADIMQLIPQRIAAMGGYPITHFTNTSPGGLNATGDSDMRIYVQGMEAEREHMLEGMPGHADIWTVDEVIARSYGIEEPPEYEWRSLLDMSDQEIAQVSKTKAEALKLAWDMGLILDENEGRGILDGDPVFGELPELSDSELSDLQEKNEPPMPMLPPGAPKPPGGVAPKPKPPGGSP